MSTIADYFGRTYDLVAFHGDTASGVAPLTSALGVPEGEICTGVKKLAQRFVIELLTVRGSMPLQPNRGCDFLTQLRTRSRNEADVLSAFATAALQVKTNLYAQERTSDPADEKLTDAQLTKVVIQPRVLQLEITLTTVAGTSRAIILPIPTLP